jgi:hypothetical protein
MHTTIRRRRNLVLAPLLAGMAAVCTLAWSSVPASAAGTGSVSGTVRNNAGAPVADTHVILSELGRQVITADDGSFSMSNVPFGTYELRIANACKQTISSSVTVDGAESVSPTFLNRFNDDSFGHACRPTTFGLIQEQTVLPLTGDDASVAVDLPFAFPFYGIDKTRVNVDTNGYLTFGSATRVPTNLSPGDNSAPFDSIFVFWDDLLVDASASVSTATVGTAPNRVFAVEWQNVAFLGLSGSRVTFQVQLFENGRIQMGWFDLDGSQREQGGSATIGLRNGVNVGSNSAITQSFDEPALVDALQTEFVRNGVPTARAGADQTVASGTSFPLDGSGSSDPDGPSGLTFQWVQVAGPATSIADPKKAKTTVAGRSGPATLTYRLTVTDQFGRSSSDDVTVTVKSPK